jgi:TolB-like protein
VVRRALELGTAALLAVLAAAPAAAATAGQKLLAAGDSLEARARLELELAARPGDPRLLRDLGIAELHTGETARAREHLRLAASRLPRDPAARYFLGAALESADSLAAAVAEYGAALERAPGRRLRGEIRARKEAATRRLLKAEARAAVRDEARLEVEAIPESTLAVLAFENVSSSERLAPLSTGLAAMLATDLSRVRALRLVEREKLPVLLAELELERGGAFDARTTARVGKLLGARRLVKGLFVAPDDGKLELATSLVETRTGEVSAEIPRAAGSVDELFALEKRIALDLVASLGIDLTPRERAEIEQTPTRDLLAFLAFSRGLELEDGGDLAGAAAQYREAIRIDPGFSMAGERLEVAAGEAQGFAGLDRALVVAGVEAPAHLAERLRQTGARAGEALIPEPARGQAWDARTLPAVVSGCPECVIRIRPEGAPFVRPPRRGR